VACKHPLELEQKALLCYLLTSCSSEFVELFNRLFTRPLAILGPFTYEWVWIMGSYLVYPTVVRSMMSWSKEYELHSSSLLLLIPVDPVRCGLSPFLLVWCFVSDPAIPAVAMASGSMESETRVFSRLFGSLCLNSCMLVPIRP